MRGLLIRIRDWVLTQRTRAAIENRECRHDGTEPMCWECTRNATGW